MDSKNIRDFYMTLLCKWLWKLGVEDSGLWLQRVRQRYNSRVRGWALTLASLPNVSPIRKGILQCSDIVKSSVRVRLGNRQKCLFWKDKSCDRFTLAEIFLKFFAILIAPMTSVAHTSDTALRGNIGTHFQETSCAQGDASTEGAPFFPPRL